MYKTWNIRDTPTEELTERLGKTYRNIDDGYKLLRRIASIEDAKKYLEDIFRMKNYALEIDIELCRRKIEEDIIYGTPKKND